MQKIVPNLWFDNEAREAAEFYVSLFPGSKIDSSVTLHDTPSGDPEIVSFNLQGYSLMAIDGGPIFKINPSISLIINFDPAKDKGAEVRLKELWARLADGGKILMEINKYPFSELYGWVQDRYGMSWQLILTNPEGEERPMIIPSLLFTNEVAGKAKEATDFYLSVFKNSRRGTLALYPSGMEPDKEGTVMFTDFALENQWFSAMDSVRKHDFIFNEAISLIVECEDQKEIDYFWGKMSAVPEAEQCGWLKDKYGVSWQIVPSEFSKMMSTGTREQVDRMTQAFLPMKKIDLVALKKVFEG